MTETTEAKHTPGPWAYDWGDCGSEVSQPYCQVTADRSEIVIADVNDFFDREEGHANARLIAAAPDLLAALSAIVKPNGFDIDGTDGGNLERARAAIAKATGAKP